MKILLGATGSVASIKVSRLAAALSDGGKNEVRIVATPSAIKFIGDSVRVLGEVDEWQWTRVGDPVLHIELRKWADVFVIAPLSANTLAKVSNGLCDNLLTSVARAWDFSKPMFVAPAMNTAMWEHPITSRQLAEICRWGVRIIPPVSKVLACGDVGNGALAEIETIVAAVFSSLQPRL